MESHEGAIKKKSWTKWGIALAIALVIATFIIYPSVYFSPEIRARVVTPSGEPVEGAVVVASWSITGFINNARLGQLALYEAVTDKNGDFYIPQWGPRYALMGMIMGKEPTIRIFHPRFVPLVVENTQHVISVAASTVIRFRFQDQAISLVPFHGTPAEYEDQLSGLVRSLDFFLFDTPVNGAKRCYWKKVPRMLIALQSVKDELTREGIGKSIPSLQDYVAIDQPQCEDSRLFFQGYKNE
ncbi:MAG TPA: carboxypeptidase-like regulatory domain-containing protein [Burkholderiaceae bacterium]|jgi:hypothetical protein